MDFRFPSLKGYLPLLIRGAVLLLAAGNPATVDIEHYLTVGGGYVEHRRRPCSFATIGVVAGSRWQASIVGQGYVAAGAAGKGSTRECGHAVLFAQEGLLELLDYRCELGAHHPRMRRILAKKRFKHFLTMGCMDLTAMDIPGRWQRRLGR